MLRVVNAYIYLSDLTGACGICNASRGGHEPHRSQRSGGVVTGGAQGIGCATARRLVSSEAKDRLAREVGELAFAASRLSAAALP